MHRQKERNMNNNTKKESTIDRYRYTCRNGYHVLHALCRFYVVSIYLFTFLSIHPSISVSLSLYLSIYPSSSQQFAIWTRRMKRQLGKGAAES